MEDLKAPFFVAVVGLLVFYFVAHAMLESIDRDQSPTCTVERVTFPASAKECARIHKAIERRIANETT